jgi:hypothetical protein
MKPNLILHIGSPKTGTSSIQKALINNKELLNEYGYHYLECLRWHDGAHHELAFSIRDKSYGELSFCLEDSLNKIETEVKETEIDNIIISSEILFYDTEKDIESFIKLKKLFRSITLVCYLREPFDYLESLYKQMIKDPHDQCSEAPSEFIKNHLKNIQYDEILSSYKNFTNNFITLIYKKGDDIVESFFTEVLKGDGIKDFKQNMNPSNETLDGVGLKLKFHFNKQNLTMSDNEKKLNEIKFFVKKNNFKRLKVNIFSEDSVKLIKDNYQKSSDSINIPAMRNNFGEFSFQPVSQEMLEKFQLFIKEHSIES